MTYLVAALQTTVAKIGAETLRALQSPQPPPTEATLTALINDLTTVPNDFVLVLDDYHVIDAKPVDGATSVDDALSFLLEHLPPQMHLVITTRENPNLPLARLRARGQLNELRVTDLRFTPSEAAEFLNQVMGLNLSPDDITALDNRTEGWIAGLQLAAISMRGQKDTTSFIQSFTGSHHFEMDYLVEEILHQQPDRIQEFLLRTSILDRLCGPLCDAVILDAANSGQEISGQWPGGQATVSQATLEYLEQANLFIVPLDNERRWYRYHHLFADLLRKRLLQQEHRSAVTSPRDEAGGVADLHRRASIWYEENGLEIEAFQHAAAAKDVVRAERLLDGKGMPLQFRGAMAPVMHWLASLPTEELNARPSLLVTYASALTMIGQPVSRVEEILQAAEAALDAATPEGGVRDEKNRDLIGQIAAIRAMLAIPQNQVVTMVVQSCRVLEYLPRTTCLSARPRPGR